MRKLTEGELKIYDREGFVVVSDLFDKDELRAMNEELNALEKVPEYRHEKIGDHEGFILELALLSEKTRRFAEDERILTVIEDIVKPGIAIYSSKLVAKLPESPVECHWHQDNAYYNQKSRSDTRMSVWIPLQDATEENGCLWVVPASHHTGTMPYADKGYGTCRLAIREEALDVSKATPLPVRAGSLVLFDANLYHSSKGNRTGTVRRAFIISYQEATVPKGNGRQHSIVRAANA